MSVARFWAWPSALAACRSNCGAATVEPVADGRRLMTASSSARTAAASAPTAASSGAAMPSACASNAPSRCAGVTSGLPAIEAACAADEIAACVLVVGLKESILNASSALASLLVALFNAEKVERVPLNICVHEVGISVSPPYRRTTPRPCHTAAPGPAAGPLPAHPPGED